MKNYLWPFGSGKVETRAENYTEALIEAALASANSPAPSALTAAREIAAGQWGRAFASAELMPKGLVSTALRPHLGLIGRALIQQGEIVFRIEVDDGVRLTPALVKKMTGGPNPETWRYELELLGPSSTTKVTLSGDEVLHLTFAVDPDKPWCGIGPLQGASASYNLLKGLETGLGQEANGPHGNIIPTPQGVNVDNLSNDIAKLKGKVALLPTTASVFRRRDFGGSPFGLRGQAHRRRPPRAVAVQLRTRRHGNSVLAACGIPIGSDLVNGRDTGLREGFRQFLVSIRVTPVAQAYLRTDRGTFRVGRIQVFVSRRLMASDITSVAQGPTGNSLKGGMNKDKAERLAGFMD